jgi:uncharacterized membrane protein
MSIFRIIGIVLLILGIAMIATGSFHYHENKKILDTNTVDISAKEEKTVSWPRITGVIIVAGSIVLIVIGEKGKASQSSNTTV